MDDNKEIIKMKPGEKIAGAIVGAVILGGLFYLGFWLFTKLEITSGQRLLLRWFGAFVMVVMGLGLLRCAVGLLLGIVELFTKQQVRN